MEIEIGIDYKRKNKDDKIFIRVSEIIGGRVSYSHNGFFDCRSMPIDLFKERYEKVIK